MTEDGNVLKLPKLAPPGAGLPALETTLEEIVDRLKALPWASKIHIKFNSKAENTHYDDLASTITIRPQDSPEQQIENFAHEKFHASHQFLSRQFANGILSKPDFVNTWMRCEVDSILTETKVFSELGLHNKGYWHCFYDIVRQHSIASPSQFGDRFNQRRRWF